MSPTEHELRNALHAGETGGAGGLNVDALVEAGETRRAQRRVRLVSGLAAAGFVVVAATGGTLIAANSGSDGGSGGRAIDNGRAGAGAPTAGRTPDRPQGPTPSVSAPGGAGGSAAPACPDGFPRQVTPGGGGTGRFGSGGRLFARPVASVTVCGYGSVGSPAPRASQVVLHGALAQQLVASLEDATKARVTCTQQLDQGRRQYALLARATDGSTLRPVTVTVGHPTCQNQVTNGTAIRYSWQPPSGIDGILTRLGAGSGPTHVKGSPIRS